MDNLPYSKIKISKRNGKFRIIYMPNEALKKELRNRLPDLENIYQENKTEDFDHAFIKGKNCVTNASAHLSQRFVLSMDIQDFFDSITALHLINYVPEDILSDMMVDNKVPQGYPTSPMLANIAMIAIDEKIKARLPLISDKIVYTRYADDLTFSFDEKHLHHKIIQEISTIFRFFNLKINKKKTRLQDKHNGRAIITGIGVSNDGVHPTRKTIKKIRAARHQNNQSSLNGLLEWAWCKPPNALS